MLLNIKDNALHLLNQNSAEKGFIENALHYSLILAVVAVFSREALAVPIRVYIPGIWYLPDVMCFFSVFLLVVLDALKGKFYTLFLLGGLFVWAVFSIFSLNYLSVLFALRLFMMILLGFFVARENVMLLPLLQKIMWGLVFVLIASIFYDYQFHLSWGSSSFTSITGEEREVLRVWWEESGVRRISGFCISSTQAALLLTLTVIFLMQQNKGLNKNILLKLGIIAITFTALYLTTQKASMAVFLFFSIVILFTLQLGKDSGILKLKIYKILFMVSFVAFIFSPFLLSGFEIGSFLGSKGASMNDRAMVIWPMAIDRLLYIPTFIIGDGLGSAGEAAQFTSASMAIPPDNLFLYLSIQTGIIFSLSLFAWIFYKVFKSEKEFIIPALTVLIIIFFNGVTANILANIIASFYFGFTVGYISYFGISEHEVRKKYTFLTRI